MIMTGGFFFLLDAYRRHRLPGICFILQALLKKQKIPSQHLCWDRKLPAVPPGLALLIKRPLFTYGHMRIVVNGEVRSVAHTPPWGVSVCPRKSIRSGTFRRDHSIRGSLRERRGDLLTLPLRFGCMIPRARALVKKNFSDLKQKGRLGTNLDRRPAGWYSVKAYAGVVEW